MQPLCDLFLVSQAVQVQQPSQHFDARPHVDAGENARLLASIDNALRSVSAAQTSTAQRDALAALAGIRRDLFPAAPPYQPSPVLEKEIR